MKRFELCLGREEEQEFRRMLEEVKHNLQITGIRKKVSNNQAAKFILFQMKGKGGW